MDYYIVSVYETECLRACRSDEIPAELQIEESHKISYYWNLNIEKQRAYL